MDLVCLVVVTVESFENDIDVFAEILHFGALVGIEDVFQGERM